MGSSHSIECNEICKTIWEWCIVRNIWLSAAYLPWKDNGTADKESRKTDHSLEWMLNKGTLNNALMQLKYEPNMIYLPQGSTTSSLNMFLIDLIPPCISG